MATRAGGAVRAAALLVVLALVGACSGDPAPEPSGTASATPSAAPEPLDVVRQAATEALERRSVRFTYRGRYRDSEGSWTRYDGTGRADLRRGRLEMSGTLRMPGFTLTDRTVVIGRHAWVLNRTGVLAGKPFQTAIPRGDREIGYFTSGGTADPEEYLRLFTDTLGVRRLGTGEVAGVPVTTYQGRIARSVLYEVAPDRRKAGALLESMSIRDVPAAVVRVHLDAQGVPVQITVGGSADGNVFRASMRFTRWDAPVSITRIPGASTWRAAFGSDD